MFTGIIEEVGKVESLNRRGTAALLEIRAAKTLEGMQLGHSIAVNGVCLTVRRQTSGGFQAELSQETLHRSNLGELKAGSLVNLERPLLPTSRLGGHFVQGHVDGVGEVLAIRAEGEFAVWKFLLPASVRRYVVEKGSIAVDGISLTVASLREDVFEVALIPRTLENTNLRARQTGDHVNLECDVLAKYVESLLSQRERTPEKPLLTEEYLKDRGY
ncbi:MAG: riboflavin synthase [Acidobacteriales bacterium]|nr:riboflavin synthase [Terriglobales bacterium]MCI0625417.1 riboflavin synthase [Acidobacteriota bacterium]MCI0717547.1 riboflavin synthase [Acidobacteriota bacterium]